MKLALVNLNMEGNDRDPNLGLAYLAGYARKYGSFNDIVIIDEKDPLKAIHKQKPDIVGFGPVTGQYPMANALAGEIKKQMNVTLIIGGHHISALPHHLGGSNFDIAVIGEGEQTLLDLLQSYSRHHGFEESDLHKINGIAFKDRDGKCIITPPRALITDMDSIPFPARDLLKMKDFYATFRRGLFDEPGIYAHMITSRGCPYNCRFCSTRLFWKRPRFHSPEYVVAEMKHLKDTYNLDGILIYDDLFLIDMNRVKKIAELLEKEGINKDLKLLIFGRANLITEDVMKVLARMNVRSMDFGLESGSDKILGYLKNGTVKAEDNRRALQLCKKYGVRTIGTIIIGSPDETEEDLQLTMDLVKDPNLDEPVILQLTPLPGTEVWDYALKKGIVSDDPAYPFDSLIVRVSGQINITKFMSNTITRERLQEWQTMMHKVAVDKIVKLNYSHIKLKHIPYIFSKRFITKIYQDRKEMLLFLKDAIFKKKVVR